MTVIAQADKIQKTPAARPARSTQLGSAPAPASDERHPRHQNRQTDENGHDRRESQRLVESKRISHLSGRCRDDEDQSGDEDGDTRGATGHHPGLAREPRSLGRGPTRRSGIRASVHIPATGSL